MAETHAARKTGNRPQHGLMLLEVTIVVAITAVVAAVAAPSLGTLIDARRLDSAATRLAADIQLARSEAIARNRPLRLSLFSGSGATCWIVHSGAPPTAAAAPLPAPCAAEAPARSRERPSRAATG